MGAVRYIALGPLLSGAGSRAFLGLEVRNEAARPVVLVWVPEDAASTAEGRERLRRETEHAVSLDHPNIIRVFGLAAMPEGLARVVEFADGESLRRVLEVIGRLPPQFAAKIIADAAMGAHYAHVAGNEDGEPLVHGGIRPETLIVSFNGVCKVSGYGALSVAPREVAGQRVTGRDIHTAPEQILGGRETANRQTDVYLLGLSLYECLTGVVPFAGEKDLEQAVLTLTLPPFPAEVPEPLRSVVLRATAKKAPDRYPTPLALRDAIEEAMGGSLPSSETLSTYLYEFFPPSDEHRSARRHAIDAGIAEFARQQWEERAKTGAAPEPATIPVVPIVAQPRTPAPRPAPARAAPPQPPPRKPSAPPKAAPAPSYDEPEPSRYEPKSYTKHLAVGGIALAVLGLAWAATRGGDSKPQTVVSVTEPAPEPPKPPPEPTPLPDAGPPPEPKPPEPPPPEPKPAAEPPSLHLSVEPAVELVIDGKSVGRSPFSGPMEPGRHVVKLLDKGRGISTSRVVVVKDAGKTTERITLAKGYVTVSAPDGARILIDGRKVGKAPIGEISVYEGSHKIQVLVGKAKWQQAFSVRANERMYFSVEAQ